MMKITLLIVKLIIIINVIITSTIAQPTIIRCCHGSTVANNKLYVGGGLTGPVDNDIWTDDFFSLDLTKPFPTSSPTDMPYEVHANVPIKSNAHTLVYAKNAKGGMIYLFGGFRESPPGNPIYGYSPDKNAWSSITPEVRDGVIIPVKSTTKIVGVTDSGFETIYIFDNRTMFINDVLNNLWEPAGSLAPFNLVYYAAVMLDTREIAYIGGGYFGTNNVPMEQILLYDTKLSIWYTKTAKASINGKIPSPRQGHSASIAPDGRIFVYGGFDGNEDEIESVGSNPTFAVLEYVNGEFEWSSPELFNQSSAMRIYHTSHVYENYLIVAFGRNLTHSRLNTIDFIDIKNRDSYTVVADFVPADFKAPSTDPPATPSTNPTSSQSAIKSSQTTIIIAAVFGTVGFLTITIGCVFFFIRFYRNQNAIPTPSGNDKDWTRVGYTDLGHSRVGGYPVGSNGKASGLT